MLMMLLLLATSTISIDIDAETPLPEVVEEGRTARTACEDASVVLPDMLYAKGVGYTDILNPVVSARLDRCAELVAKVEAQGEEMVLTTIAVAYVESNFNPEAIGAAGERGMLQVIPRYHCVDVFSDGQGGCVNPEGAGIKFLAHLRSKYTSNEALRRYNGSQVYATKVGGYVRQLEG